jgi:hypothetical protein
MTYSPFGASGAYPSGPVSTYPWRGRAFSYPDGTEDFSGYDAQPGQPDEIECSSTKGERDHLDVTSGCLDCVLMGSENQYTRGQVRCPDSDFRVLALAYSSAGAGPIKWTDCGMRFRFHGHQTGESNYPGIKAFQRYRTEDDLYVASWRWDGVAQIQKKWNGVYSTLALNSEFGPPAPDEWHWFAFEAKGQELRLLLDDQLILQCTSATFSWGTCGIRIDGTDGCYLDDWSVYQPL